MSSVDMGEGVADALRGQDRGSPLYSVADLLCLAAAPTFAAMALLTAVSSGPADIICATSGQSPMGGMAPMYLLMSAFHLAPWLKLIGRRGSVKRG